MARITWQNVTAPDFRGVAEASSLGAGAFARGMENLADVLGESQARKRTQASNQALERMLQFGDVDSWDAALQRGGLSAIGINSDMATGDLMKAFQGRRNDLEGERYSDQQAARNQFALKEDQYGFERTKLMHNRADEEFARSEDNRLLREWAQEEIHKMATGNGNRDAGALSMDELLLNVRDLDLSARENRALMDAARGFDSDEFKVDPDTKFTNQELYRNTERGLMTLDRQELNAEFADNSSSNTAARAYRNALSSFGGDVEDAGSAMIKRLGADQVDEDGNAVFGQAPGKLRAAFNDLKGRFNMVPDVMIADAMARHLEDDRFWNPLKAGDSQKVDVSAVIEELKHFETEEGRNSLQKLNEGYLVERKDREEKRSKIQKLTQEIIQMEGLGSSRGAIARKEAELQQVLESIAPAADPADGIRDAGTSGEGAADSNGGIPLPTPISFGGSSSSQEGLSPEEQVVASRAAAANLARRFAGAVDETAGDVAGAGNTLGGWARSGFGNLAAILGSPELGAAAIQSGREQRAVGNAQLVEGFSGQRTAAASQPEVIAEVSSRLNALLAETQRAVSSGNTFQQASLSSKAQELRLIIQQMGDAAPQELLEQYGKLRAAIGSM